MLRLQQVREQEGLNKIDVARGAEIDQAAYGRIESGFRKPYGPEKERLAEFFDVSQDELFTEVTDQ